MKEISIQEFENIRIGQVEDAAAATGVTAFVCPDGMWAGLDVRGGGPASHESELLAPLAHAKKIHAVVLSGGSAFGLEAASGVMQALEEADIGYPVGVCKVPLVVQSALFDLTVGASHIRPDKAMCYAAARAALAGGNYRDGNFGAGCGASVGKWGGMETAMKSGIGSYALKVGRLKVGAVVAVNALGDIYDHRTGKKLAGLLNNEKTGFGDAQQMMMERIRAVDNKFTGNTTLGVVLTNAAFDQPRLSKIAGMAHDGYARSIKPVHTSADGDSIYACSLGDVKADMDIVGALAADVMSMAIINAVRSAEAAYGLKCARDFEQTGGKDA